MSDGVFGLGTLLKLHDGDATFNTVAEVTDLSGPSMSADSVEYTNHSSPNRTREFKPGLVDPGEITASLNWIPSEATHGVTSGIPYLLKSGIIREWQIVWPSGEIWTVEGFVTAFEPTAPIDDKLAADITIKLTGFPEET